MRSNARSLPTRLRLRRGAEHLVRLGPRAVSEFLLESAQDKDDVPTILDRLDYWRKCLTPELLRDVGADRFPPELQLVPEDLDEERERRA